MGTMKYIKVTCRIDCPFSKVDYKEKFRCHHPVYVEAQKGYPEIPKELYYANELATNICKLPDLKENK